MTDYQEFVETGAHVVAIQHDGSEERAAEITEFVQHPLVAEALPRGAWNQDELNIYLTLKSLYALVYISPGDWVVENDGQISVVHAGDFEKGYLETTKPKSHLTDHARRELLLLGEDAEMTDWYLTVVSSFVKLARSGKSVTDAIPIVNRLLQYQNLTELTDNPDDWKFIGANAWDEMTGTWQNIRNTNAFSNDGGKHYYLLSEGGPQTKVWHTSAVDGEKHVPV